MKVDLNGDCLSLLGETQLLWCIGSSVVSGSSNLPGLGANIQTSA